MTDDPAAVDNCIYPTHHCFDDALELLEERLREDARLARSNTLLLVHGVIRGPIEQADLGRVAHAWLEEKRENGWYVWGSGLLHGQRIFYCATRDEFYRSVRVERQSITRYTPADVLRENRRSRHYGPWRADLAALCRPRS